MSLRSPAIFYHRIKKRSSLPESPIVQKTLNNRLLGTQVEQNNVSGALRNKVTMIFLAPGPSQNIQSFPLTPAGLTLCQRQELPFHFPLEPEGSKWTYVHGAITKTHSED